jgi:glycerol uptake facilitator-like aquaporin
VKSSLAQRTVAECLGTAFLLAAVVGSGIMAARLAGGNGALALLCNTLPTGAILTVLILTLGPISGAHFNPAVSAAMALRGDLGTRSTAIYISAQVIGGVSAFGPPTSCLNCRYGKSRPLREPVPANGSRKLSPLSDWF